MSRGTASSSVGARFCRGCGYPLVHLEGRRCPECGREFDPGDPATYASRPPRGWGAWVKRLAVLMGVGVVVYGAGLGWLYWEWRGEQSVVLLIESNGSVLYREVGWPWVGWAVPKFARGWLKRADVARLDSDGFTDESIATVSTLRELRELRLMNTIVSAQALESLDELPKLEFLTFSGYAVNDDGLRRLYRLRRLRQLILVDTNTSAEAVEAFRAARPDVSVMVISSNPQ